MTKRLFRSRMLHGLRPRTLVITGDSTAAGGDVRSDTAPKYGLTTYGPPALDAGFRILRNAAVGGETSAQILSRFDAEVVGFAPDAVLIAAGTNDVAPSVTDAAIATMMNNIEQMVLKALDAGIIPIIVTQPPSGSTVVAERAKVQPFYHWLAEYYGLPLIDMYKYFVDGTTGEAVSGYTDDTVHPNETGKLAVFDYIAACLADLPSCRSDYFADYSVNVTGSEFNLLRNGSFGLGNASSLNGWALNLTGDTHTLETPTLPKTGRISKHVIGADGGRYLLQGDVVTGVSPGDELILSGRLKVSDTVATANTINISLIWRNSGGSSLGSATLFNAWARNSDISGSLRAVCPSGADRFNITVYTDKAGTYELSNLTVINRNQLAAIWQPGQQGS